jgi:uncharacterized SAM-binding protein YcdF (DUF218 family)
MPVSTAHPRRRLRLLAGITALLIVAAAAYSFVEVGRFLAPEDPLQKADAVFVFAGRYVERPLEAGDLYREGYAPRIVITRDRDDMPVPALERRGINIPTHIEVTRRMLQEMQIPDEAIITPDRIHDHTSDEAETLRHLALKYQWRRVILVSSKYHLRRVAFAASRALRGTGVEIVLRATRYDNSTPARWWTRRADIRWIASEVPKFIGYRLGFT